MNLLTDSLITVADSNGNSSRFSLPAIYELAASDAISDFPRIRPHQIPAFHAFLVQLGCIACEAADLSSPPENAGEWQHILRSLTAAWPNDEPWQLVVADRAQPAFLQPAQPEGAPPLKTVVEQPDKLDLLVTSKNHDLKQRRMGSGSAEDWFFALLSVQTQEGFLGQGNYGIARMNGGFANRSFLTVAREQAGFGGRVFRDIHALLSNLEAYYKKTITRSGHTLLWLEPWDGSQSLAVQECHPLFIEVCRRIRLIEHDGVISAALGNSKVPRVDAKAFNGDVGDPWLPLDIKSSESKAMTLAADGFSYRRMAQLLSGFDGRYQLPFLAEPTKDEKNEPMAYEAYGLVRGQGKTEGFHRRRVLVPRSALWLFHDKNSREKLAERCGIFLDLAAHASGKALRPALIQLYQGKADIEWNKPSNETLCRPWLKRLDGKIDKEFFPVLFRTPDENEAQREFSQVLKMLVQSTFNDAAEAAPHQEDGRDIARARAELLLARALRKHLPALRTPAATVNGEVHE